MFKLSVISDEISQDFERVLQVAQDYDVPQVEPRSVWDNPPQDIPDADVAKMQKLLEQYGMSVCCIASPFLKCDLGDEEQYQEHLGILRRCIELAHTFNCKIIRGFTFWRTGPPQDVWQQLLDAYEEPIKICEQEDVYIGIENESSTHIGSAGEAEQLYKAMASPRVRAIWDPANEVFAEGGELPYPTAFERMKPFLIHVHIKDAVKADTPEKGRCVPVGDGGYIDYPGQFQALIDMGYEGACSLETHWRPDEELDSDLLNQPGGAAFSATGEPASRICFENIKRILAGLNY